MGGASLEKRDEFVSSEGGFESGWCLVSCTSRLYATAGRRLLVCVCDDDVHMYMYIQYVIKEQLTAIDMFQIKKTMYRCLCLQHVHFCQ